MKVYIYIFTAHTTRIRCVLHVMPIHVLAAGRLLLLRWCLKLVVRTNRNNLNKQSFNEPTRWTPSLMFLKDIISLLPFPDHYSTKGATNHITSVRVVKSSSHRLIYIHERHTPCFAAISLAFQFKWYTFLLLGGATYRSSLTRTWSDTSLPTDCGYGLSSVEVKFSDSVSTPEAKPIKIPLDR